MTISEYKQLSSVRFPNLNTEKTEEGIPLSKIGLVEKVALEIFKEGTKSNTKLNIVTRKMLKEYDKNKQIFFENE